MRGQFGYFLHLIWMVVFLGLHLFSVQICTAAGKKQQISTFAEIYEPSTVIELVDGSVLIAEDEGDQPLYISRLVSLENDLRLEPVRLRKIDPALDDLEGSGLGKDGAVYLITSHSKNKKGKRKKEREILARLTFKNGKISKSMTYDGLFFPLIEALEGDSEIEDAEVHQLDVEGLCFDSSKERLLLGLRSPLADKKAVILVLENPYNLINGGQAPRFQRKNIYLNLGGGGIRSITYDSQRKVYLIANEIPNKKGKLRPMVWAWDGTSRSLPARVVLPKLKGIKNIEGMTLVKIQKKIFILMVTDDGNRKKKKGGHYIFLDTSALVY
jgi:hypothetical protein